VNHGSVKLAAFWELFRLYTKQRDPVPCPRIKMFKASKQSRLKPGEWIVVSVNASYSGTDELQYRYFCSTSEIGTLQYYVNTAVPVAVKGKGEKVMVQAPAKSGLYRLYVLVKNSQNNGAVQNMSIEVE
jgi:hypothetical protein